MTFVLPDGFPNLKEKSSQGNTRRILREFVEPALINLNGSKIERVISYEFVDNLDIETLETYSRDLKLLKGAFNLNHRDLIREDPDIEEPLSSGNLTFRDQRNFLLALFDEYGCDRSRLDHHQQFVASIRTLRSRQQFLDNPSEFFPKYRTYIRQYGYEADPPRRLGTDTR